MRRVRLWARFLYLRSPGLGYVGAAVLCWGLSAWRPIPWEWVWFVVLPGLLGAAHFVGPTEGKRGWGYWGLAGIWFAAAGFGALAHWHALGPATPWLSLIRYSLLVLGANIVCLSFFLDHPYFAGKPPRLRGSLWRRLGHLPYLLVLWAAIWFIASELTVWQLALAPPHSTATMRVVKTFDQELGVLWAAWSPDSTRFIAQVGREIWLVVPSEGRVTRTAAAGVFSWDRPWLASGEAFFFSRENADGQRSAWLASRDGEVVRKVMDGAGSVTCSPDGRRLAFSARSSVWLANPDGTGRRLLMEDGLRLQWSPDGKHAILRRRPKVRGRQGTVWLATQAGGVSQLPIPYSPMRGAWVSPTAYAAASWEEGSDRRRESVEVWTLRGSGRGSPRPTADGGHHEVLGYQGGSFVDVLAAAPDGRWLAIAEAFPGAGDMLLTILTGDRGRRRRDAAAHNLLLAEVDGRGLSRLPSPASVSCASWSPDGRHLAVGGDDAFSLGPPSYELQHRPCLAIISGL